MKIYRPNYEKFQNSYRIWYTLNGKYTYEDLTEVNEERAAEKFSAYFPTATIEDIELCREGVRCY